MNVQTVTSERKELVTVTGKRKRLFKFKGTVLGPVLAFIAFLSLWQLIPLLFGIAPFILPKPTDVIQAALENWTLLSPAIQITLGEAIIGFLLSAIIGIFVSVLLASSRILEISIYPYAIILQTIPVVAIAPIIVIWFGSGFNSIVIISFIFGLFPIISNTLMGINSVDKNMQELFTLYNASKWQSMWKLRIPAALPYITAGLKVSSTLTILGAITGEYIAGIGGGKGGLGYAITVAAVQLKTPYLFACGIASAIFGIVFYLLVSYLSNMLLKSWHESAMKVEK